MAQVRKRETVVREQPVVDTKREIIEDPNAPGRVLVARIAGLMWLLFGMLDVLIVLRVILKLIAANPANPFAQFVYNLSSTFLAPFSSLIASPIVGNGVFEISSMVALVVYTLLAWIVVRLFRLIFTPGRTQRRVTTYHSEQL